MPIASDSYDNIISLNTFEHIENDTLAIAESVRVLKPGYEELVEAGFQKAEEKPADTLRREGVSSVNPRHELEWKLSLPADSEKKITYRYSVLVAN